jgi:hypothetical protein
MEHLGEVSGCYALAFNGLAKGDLVTFGLGLDTEFVALKSDPSPDGRVQLLLVFVGGLHRLAGHFDQRFGFGELKISLGGGEDGVLPLGFEGLVGSVEQLLGG